MLVRNTSSHECCFSRAHLVVSSVTADVGKPNGKVLHGSSVPYNYNASYHRVRVLLHHALLQKVQGSDLGWRLRVKEDLLAGVVATLGSKHPRWDLTSARLAMEG